MNYYLQNFVDLFSEDDSVVYQALQAKKDWMFRKLYLKVKFSKSEDAKIPYPEIFATMDHAIHFDKLPGESEVIKKFNESYRYKTLTENIELEKSSFLIELNLYSMDDKAYRDLVANFYPCMSIDELEIVNDGNVMNLLKLPMIGKKGEWVLVISKDQLLNDNYYLPCFKKIIYGKNCLKEQEMLTVEEICSNLKINMEEINLG
jgi:hypothetical protein